MKKRMAAALIAVLLWLGVVVGRGTVYRAAQNTSSAAWQGTSSLPYVTISVYTNEFTPISLEQAKGAASYLEQRASEINEAARSLCVWGKRQAVSLRVDDHAWQGEGTMASEGFFLVHRFPVISGAVYAFGGRGVVLNEGAARALFGSGNCAGADVWYEGVRVPVLAVVADGGTTAAAYVPYTDEEQEASFFEAVLPEFVKGFALDGVHGCFFESENTVIVCNDTRFEPEALWQRFRSWLSRQQPAGFHVPAWEYAEQHDERVLMLWHLAADVARLAMLVALALLVMDLVREDPFDLHSKLKKARPRH